MLGEWLASEIRMQRDTGQHCAIERMQGAVKGTNSLPYILAKRSSERSDKHPIACHQPVIAGFAPSAFRLQTHARGKKGDASTCWPPSRVFRGEL